MMDNTLQKEKENQILDFVFYWGRPIRAGEIVDKLHIKHSTLNSVLKRLVDENYIKWEKYGLISLTEAGEEAAAHLSNHHFIIEYFLKQTLDLEDEVAHSQAMHLAGRADCVLIDAICEKFHLTKSQNHANLCEQRKYFTHSDVG